MPYEDRRIVFDYSEAYKAIYALCVQKNMSKPPAGMLKAIDTTVSPLKLTIENPQLQTDAELSYSTDFLAAALMLACRSEGIPLPKRGKKSVDFGDAKVILRVII